MGEESKSGDGTLRAIGADEVLSAVELAKLIETAQTGLEKVKIMLAIFTGLRHGELNGLRWSCVDLERGRILVNRSLTEIKGGAILERPKLPIATFNFRRNFYPNCASGSSSAHRLIMISFSAIFLAGQ
jgi:integrase